VEQINRISIKHWAIDDRPREKLLHKGKDALSDAELIAVLLGSGTTTQSAVDISKTILSHVNNDINELAAMGVKDLTKFSGIGEARAISIISALELGRRRKTNGANTRPTVRSSQDVHTILKEHMMDLGHEEFWILLLNRRNGVIKKTMISSGGVAGTVVDPRIILKGAIEELASGLVLAHNHPSGSVEPSEKDLKLTKNIAKACEYLDIKLLDHVIFAQENYFSFANAGLL